MSVLKYIKASFSNDIGVTLLVLYGDICLYIRVYFYVVSNVKHFKICNWFNVIIILVISDNVRACKMKDACI